MSKKIIMRLSAIAMVAMLSLGFASCSGDDEENGPQTGKTEKTDYGKDGLKGYWMEEPTTQNWMAQGNKACYFFYLDGEGGGTWYYPGWAYDSERFSTAYQEKTGGDYGTIPYTKLFKKVKDNAGNIYTLYGFEEVGSTESVPLIYTRAGTTLIIDDGDIHKRNVIDGTISGYKRVTIVN